MSPRFVGTVTSAAVFSNHISFKDSKHSSFLLPASHGQQHRRRAISWLGICLHSGHHQWVGGGWGSSRSLQLDHPAKEPALSGREFQGSVSQRGGRWDVPSIDMCLPTPFSEHDVALWRIGGHGTGAVARPRSGRCPRPRDPFAFGAHLLLVRNPIDFQHDVDHPCWQWSGARQLAERRCRRGALNAGDPFLRGWRRPPAGSSEQPIPESLPRGGGPATPRAGRHCSEALIALAWKKSLHVRWTALTASGRI